LDRGRAGHPRGVEHRVEVILDNVTHAVDGPVLD
jgi:hypothetical protein